MPKVKSYVILADMHYPKIHKPTLNGVLEYLDENPVDGVVLQGDQLDFECISHHTKNKPLYRLRNGFMKDVQGFNRDVLAPIEVKLKRGAEKYWIDGNHERFAADLVEEQPELEDAVDYKKILNLETRGWHITPLGHSLKLGKLNIVHGEVLSGIGNQAGMYPARKAVELYAGNVLAAHTHAMQMYTKISPVEHTQKWAGYVNGIIGETNPSYLRNRPTAWSHGFAILEVHEDGNFNLHLIHVHNGRFSYGGKVYGGK
jgi:Calcineurin-like phosphoesterase